MVTWQTIAKVWQTIAKVNCAAQSAVANKSIASAALLPQMSQLRWQSLGE